jgi:ankyrin repeat protein
MAAQEDVEDLQKRVVVLSESGKTTELGLILRDHPELDVNVCCENFAGQHGWPALHFACHEGHTACAQLLVHHKADVNAKRTYE